MAKKRRHIWVNGLDPLDHRQSDPLDNLESAGIGQRFWSWETDTSTTWEDIKRIGEDSGRTKEDQEDN